MFGNAERHLLDNRDTSYFLRFAKNFTSQGGEDGILDEIFRLVGTSDTPYCVEIGAWDGKHLSNTYQLVFEKRWGGLLVEANPERCHALSTLYSNRPDVACLACLVDIEGEHSLANILHAQQVAEDLDFISIDVDGADYHLWDSIGRKYTARVVCIEFNPSIANHVHYVQPRDITVQEGSSLLALVELGRSMGYHIVATTTFNAIFVRADLLYLLPDGIFTYLPPLGSQSGNWTVSTPVLKATLDRTVDLNSLHNCAMVTDMYQTYSGELKFCGPKKLLWHRVPMNPQQMQVVKSKKERVFPFKPPYQQSITTLERDLAAITTELAKVMSETARRTVTLDALAEASSSMLRECTAVFGLACSDLTKGAITGLGSPLRGIAEETLLNALVMVVIAQHRTAVAHAKMAEPGAESVLQVLVRFIEESADLCERIGDLYWDNYSNAASSAGSKEVLLQEAARWWERALCTKDNLKSASDRTIETPIAVHCTKDTRRLRDKLSGCCLAQVAGTLPWDPVLKASCEGAAEPAAGPCRGADEMDAVLRGLHWNHVPPFVHETCAAAAADATESERRRRLAKKWRAKLHWAEEDTSAPLRAPGSESLSDGTTSARWGQIAWMAASFAVGTVVGLHVVLKFGWRNR
jgi:hypothetical protein